MRPRLAILAAAAVVLPLIARAGTGAATGEAEAAVNEAHLPLTLSYDRDLAAADKRAALAATERIFADLGIELVTGDAAVRASLDRLPGQIEGKPVDDVDLVYDAVYYLTDLIRLPAEIYPLFERIVVVDSLRSVDARTGRLERRPFADRGGMLVVDHAHLNQREMFGAYMHPKVNYAMLLEAAIEAHLRALPAAVRRELGLDVVVEDSEWVRLNGGDNGWRVYNGEELAFIGWRTALRVTPPGIVYDAVREATSGVPADAYRGLPEMGHPWWSPRHSPEIERASLLRSMFSRSPKFFRRLAGGGGVREDAILREKTRLVLYAAFVASGGVLDQRYWTRRHRGSAVVAELTRDFDRRHLRRLNERLARRGVAGDFRIAPPARSP